MIVANLRKLLVDVPDNALVVVQTPDHSYRQADVIPCTALFGDREITEDHGEECTPEEEYGERRPVLVIC